MEKFKPKPSLSQELYNQYLKKVKNALDNRIDGNLYDKFYHFGKRKSLPHVHDPITFIKTLREYVTLKLQMKNAVINVETISELKILLDAIKVYINIDANLILAHENAHANVADSEKESKHLGYVAEFYKRSDNSTNLKVGAKITHPDISANDISLEQIEAVERIIKAPETYGVITPEKNLADDAVMLKYLEERKNEIKNTKDK